MITLKYGKLEDQSLRGLGFNQPPARQTKVPIILLACGMRRQETPAECKLNNEGMLMQDRTDKVQSFSKFQAELRAQQRQDKSSHKLKHDKRDKRHRADKAATPKATPVASPGQAENVQASPAHCVILFVKCVVNTMLSLTACVASAELS